MFKNCHENSVFALVLVVPLPLVPEHFRAKTLQHCLLNFCAGKVMICSLFALFLLISLFVVYKFPETKSRQNVTRSEIRGDGRHKFGELLLQLSQEHHCTHLLP